MSSPDRMPLLLWHKAERLLAADARAAWEQANPAAKRRRPRYRHQPYQISARAELLVAAMGMGDPERVLQAIYAWWEYAPEAFGPDGRG